MGLLACGTPKIPFRPLTFLRCLRALAFPPPLGEPAHCNPPPPPPTPTPRQVLPSAFPSQRWPRGCLRHHSPRCPVGVLMTVDPRILTVSCPQAPFQGSSCNTDKFCLVEMVFVLTAKP